ncbi:MAG: HAD family hydrolase [Candidatus ainarchaeum sp.]|nr:HAD family hydrolase [Candidatus ainarchaeum sp.]
MSLSEKLSKLRLGVNYKVVQGTKSKIRTQFKKIVVPKTSKNVIIDIDGTLIDTNLSLELLKTKIGEEQAEKKYAEFKSMVVKKGISPDVMLLKAHEYIRSLNPSVNLKDYEITLSRVLREGKVNQEVLESIQYLKRIGKNVVLVTKSSEVFAKSLAKQFGLSAGLGAEEAFGVTGNLVGLKSIVAEKNTAKGKVKLKSKLQRIKEWCKINNQPFSKRSTVVLSDSIFDAAVLRKAGLGVLYISKNSGSEQKKAEEWKLRDYAVKQRAKKRTINELKRVLRYPQLALKNPRFARTGTTLRHRK